MPTIDEIIKELRSGPNSGNPVFEDAADVIETLREVLGRLVNAEALKNVRGIVAGWNGEDKPGPYNERHPKKLGATLPKTNCGAVYELDDAMVVARDILSPPQGTSNDA